MNAPRFLQGLLLAGLGLLFGCLDEHVVVPGEDLPAVLAVDHPTVYLFRYARGQKIDSAVVAVTNNGEGSLGVVEMVGGVDYVQGERYWLEARVEPQGQNEARLVLHPRYGEDEQDAPDVAEVVLKATNSPDLKTVTILRQTLPGAAFEFSVSPLAFSAFPGDPPGSTDLTVRNGGNGILWIRPPEVRDSLGAVPVWLSSRCDGERAFVLNCQVDADPGGLPGGEYTAFLLFLSDPSDSTQAKPAAVPVTMKVAQPTLSVSAEDLRFTFVLGSMNLPKPETIFLENAGPGAFDRLGSIGIGEVQYRVGGEDWLKVERRVDSILVDSTPVDSIVSVLLTATPGSLQAGVDTATVPLSSTHGGDVGLTVEFVIGSPILTLSSRAVSFGIVQGDADPPDPQIVGIKNSGAGTLEALGALSLGTASPLAPWIQAELRDSTLTLEPTAASTSLGVGTHTTALPIRSVHGGAEDLSITFAVSRPPDPPSLALSASAVRFSAMPAELQGYSRTKTVSISNRGGGDFSDLGTISIQDPGDLPAWLSADLNGGTLTLTATGSAVPADGGPHSAQVAVSSTRGGDGTVDVDFSIGDPILTLSSRSASLTQGSPSETVNLSNTGAGVFDDLGEITHSDDADWLGTSLSGTTFTLSADVGGLTPQNSPYTATASVSSANGGGPREIQVALTIPPDPEPPVLTLSAGSATFFAKEGDTADPPSQGIEVYNGGGGGGAALGGIGCSEGAAWLDCQATSATLTLSATLGGLTAENSPYSESVTVSSDEGGDRTVDVSFVVLAATAADDEIDLATHSVRLDGLEGTGGPLTQEVLIFNGGGGDFDGLGNLTATADPNEPWLSASVDGDAVRLSASLEGLTAAASPYSAEVQVESNKGSIAPAALQVTLDVRRPALTLSSRSASLTPEAPSASVTISNTGAGTFGDLGEITCTDDADWLAPCGGDPDNPTEVPGQTLSLSLIEAQAPGDGVHTASVNLGTGSGQTGSIRVTLTVAPEPEPPTLELSSRSATFYANAFDQRIPASQSIEIFNAGGGGFGDLGDLTSTVDRPWLSASVDGSTLTLTVNELQPVGTHAAAVTVSSSGADNSPLDVDVTFLVRTSSLAVSPRALSFSDTVGGSGPSERAARIANTGGGSFTDLGRIALGETVYAEGAVGWLEAVYVEPDSVGVRPVTGELLSRADPYEARIPVSSTRGGNDTILVSFSVRPGATPPSLSLSRRALVFEGLFGGEPPPAQSVTVSNSGGGALGPPSVESIEYHEGDQGWLEWDPPAPDDSLTVILRPVVDFGSLKEESSRATVTLASASGEEILRAPMEVALSFQKPVLSLSTGTVAFSDTVGSGGTLRTNVFIENAGAGPPDALGAITVFAEAPWAAVSLESVEGDLPRITVEVTADGLEKGEYEADVRVDSEFADPDTLAVTFKVREPDASFDEPVIQFVDPITRAPLPGDSLRVVAESTATTVVDVGVRNGSRSVLELLGLSVPATEPPPGEWLRAFFDRTTASFDNPAALSVVIEKGLPPGSYQGRVTVRSMGTALHDAELFGTLLVLVEVR